MEYIKALILGLVQGLTEFLPISSSGHLILVKYFLGFSETNDISFEIFVHLGSLVAVFIFFRKEIFGLLQSIIYYKKEALKNNRIICCYLLIATMVTAILGFICKGLLVELFHPIFVALMIAITGVILYISDRIKNAVLASHQLNIKKAIFIGLGQALAITPGISRSGTTITFGFFAGLDRKSAASFSFLLSIPAILGANITEMKTFIDLSTDQLLIYMIGFISAFLAGYFVIKILMDLIQKAKLSYFSYYCWGIAGICLLLIIMGV